MGESEAQNLPLLYKKKSGHALRAFRRDRRRWRLFAASMAAPWPRVAEMLQE